MSQKYLITGATGFLGAHLLFRLMSENKDVTAFRRSPETSKKTKQIFLSYGKPGEKFLKQIQWLEGDVTNMHDVLQATQNIDYLIHSAAKVSFDPKDKNEIFRINVLGTKNIVEACLKNQVKKLCHVSSIAFLNPTFSNEQVDENLKRKPDENDSDYSKSKYLSELEVWRGIEHGLNTVIINPSVILGAGDTNSALPGFVRLIKSGNRFYTGGTTGFVDIEDVVEAVLRLISEEVSGERFIISSENMSYKSLFDLISKEIGLKSPDKKISSLLLCLASFLETARSSIFRVKNRLPASVVRASRNETFYTSKKFTQMFNYSFLNIANSVRKNINLINKQIE